MGSGLIERISWDFNTILYDLLMNDVQKALFNDTIRALGPLEGVQVDDWGCGTGEVMGRMPVTATRRGIELSPIAIAMARRRVPGAQFFLMDFYEQLPEGKPDKIVACRSLYHPDLSRSLGRLADALPDRGLAVVAQAVPDWFSYVRPRRNGKRTMDGKMFIKSANRVLPHIIGYNYNVFSAEHFDRVGRQFFDSVTVEEAGMGTHYMVQLKKG